MVQFNSTPHPQYERNRSAELMVARFHFTWQNMALLPGVWHFSSTLLLLKMSAFGHGFLQLSLSFHKFLPGFILAIYESYTKHTSLCKTIFRDYLQHSSFFFCAILIRYKFHAIFIMAIVKSTLFSHRVIVT